VNSHTPDQTWNPPRPLVTASARHSDLSPRRIQGCKKLAFLKNGLSLFLVRISAAVAFSMFANDFDKDKDFSPPPLNQD